MRDVTERRQGEQRQAYLLRLSDALRPLNDAVEIQTTASRLLGEQLKASRVAYAEIDGEDAIVHRDYVDGVRSVAGIHHVRNYGERVLEAHLRGELVNLPDVAKEPSLPEEARQAFAGIEAAAHLSRGLLKGGRWVAAIAVQQASPRVWTDLDVGLLDETAERTWAAVERARAEEAAARAPRTGGGCRAPPAGGSGADPRERP